MGKMGKTDGPNFAAWSHENLARFAEDAYWRMKEQQDAMEQSRRDFKDAMDIVRFRLLAG
jgi:hypothetical protein